MTKRILTALLFLLPLSAMAQGTCPSGLPVGTPANGCYYVAANGNDANNGTSESTAWLHAPGMPNCSGNCAALNAGNGGIGIILRGGDTWHEGNSAASPYTGGVWDLYDWYANSYSNNVTTCVYEGTQTGCLYIGVDPTWYASGSWSRPIITGDNPTVSGLGNYASSCAYQMAGSTSFGGNNLVDMPAWTIVDSLELTGLCSQASNTSNGQSYFSGWASSGTYNTVSMLENVYMHGWSATSSAGSGSSSHPVTVIAGGGGVRQVFDHIVIDGQDSNGEVAAWGTFPVFSHMRDSMIRWINQGVGQGCHDIHDNIFEHFTYTVLDGHTNAFECNTDGTYSTANVFYNNTFRHFDPSFGNGEVVWFCPNGTPEYWFNNLMYDVVGSGVGQPWNVVGPPIYSGCSNLGGQFMFNNTLVNANQPCYLTNSNRHGQDLTVLNEHLIDTPYGTSGSPQCTGGSSSATNISQTGSVATSQGYTTGSAGTVSANTCANDSTAACSPVSGSVATVGAGTNEQAYCTALAANTSEYAIGTEAANACRYGTTNGCAYNATSHTMTCPFNVATARPSTANFDAGAYQYAGGGTSYTLTVTASPSGGGSISGTSCVTGSYASGSPYTCNASANSGYAFSFWTDTCGGTPSGSTTTGYITANCSVTATFFIQPGTVSFSPAGGTYSGTQSVTLSNSGSNPIFYTTNGTTPTIASTEYSTAISVASTTTIKALAATSGTFMQNLQSSASNWNPPGQSGPACCGGTGTGTPSVTLVTGSPCLSSSCIEFTITSSQNETSALWHHSGTGCDTCQYGNSDYQFDPLSFSNTNAGEMDDYLFDFTRQLELMFGHQWDALNGTWDVWSGNGTSGHWVHTSVTTAPTTGMMNHVQWAEHRTIGDTSCSGTECMVYDTLTLNGTVYTLNLSEPAGPLPSGLDASTTGCQFQWDMTNAGTASFYVDNVNCGFSPTPGSVGSATYTITPAAPTGLTVSAGVKLSSGVSIH